MQKLMIPINEVLVSEMFYPAGWLVGAYDNDGFIYKQKWFPPEKLADAEAYAGTIAVPVKEAA